MKYGILKHDVFFTGPVLREMGASAADDSGILWTPRDQMVSKDGRSITLMPDPESLRRMFAKRAQTFGGRAPLAISGPKNSPANAYNRMLVRPGVKALMNRLQRRGLIPRAPQTYTQLKQVPNNRPAPKPQ